MPLWTVYTKEGQILHRNTGYQIGIEHQEEPWPFWRGGSIVNVFLLGAKWTLVFNVEYELELFQYEIWRHANSDNFLSIISESELSIVVVIL